MLIKLRTLGLGQWNFLARQTKFWILCTVFVMLFADLCELFSRLGLVRYAEVFQEQEVDLNTFMTLSDDDLKELGVATFGARRRMVLAIQGESLIVA